MKRCRRSLVGNPGKVTCRKYAFSKHPQPAERRQGVLMYTMEDVLEIVKSLHVAQRKNNPEKPSRKEYVTKRTAAELLDVTVRTVERYIENGRLTKCYRGPHRVVLVRKEVEELVKEWHS